MMEAEANAKTRHLVAKPIKRIDHNDKVYELTDWFFRTEYKKFPNSQMKDMLDAMSRIYDLDVNPPIDYTNEEMVPNDFSSKGASYYEGQCMEPEIG